MKFAVFGDGYIGKAMHKALSKKYNTALHGILSSKELTKFNICFICVPTNNIDEKTDLSNVHDAFNKIEADMYVVNSTVPVGTCAALKKQYNRPIVACPLFIGESSYYNPTHYDNDLLQWPYFIFGGDDSKTVDDAYNIFVSLFGPFKKYWFVTFEEAEMYKYILNVFWAYKLTFFSGMFDICENIGLDYKKLREIIIQDGRVNPIHTAIFKNKRGFRGKCLPKDLESFISQFSPTNLECIEILKKVKEYNNKLIK